MSFVPAVSVPLDEESHGLLLAVAEKRALPVEALVADIVREFLAEDAAGAEALRRLADPQETISLDELRRRLAS